jgi:hypothetical protein
MDQHSSRVKSPHSIDASGYIVHAPFSANERTNTADCPGIGRSFRQHRQRSRIKKLVPGQENRSHPEGMAPKRRSHFNYSVRRLLQRLYRRVEAVVTVPKGGIFLQPDLRIVGNRHESRIAGTADAVQKSLLRPRKTVWIVAIYIRFSSLTRTTYRRCSFCPMALTMMRRDFALRPCLPMIFPTSSRCASMKKLAPPSDASALMTTNSGRSTKERTILPSSPETKISFGSCIN